MAKKQATASQDAKVKVKFLKPMAPFAYHTNDVAEISLESTQVEKAIKEGFIELVK